MVLLGAEAVRWIAASSADGCELRDAECFFGCWLAGSVRARGLLEIDLFSVSNGACLRNHGREP